MDDFTFLNVSQLIYYDDDEYFPILSAQNVGALEKIHQHHRIIEKHS